MDFLRNISSVFKSKDGTGDDGENWEWEDHVLGALYGNCVGDAIGLLTEFMIKSEAKTYYGKHKTLEYEQKVPDMHRERWETGDWTDDTDQMLLILESLLDLEGKIEPTDFAKRMLDWKNFGFPELGDKGGLGIGATTKATLTHPEFTTNPHKASLYVWEANQRRIAPNGAVMRTSILGLFQYDDVDKVVENTLNICRTTHHDHRCRASCVAVTSAIAMMLQRRSRHLKENGDYDVPAIIYDSFQLAVRCLPDDDGLPDNEAIALLRHHMYASSLKDLQLNEIGKIGYTYKCMGAGFWALRQNDFRKAISDITFEAGDADTNGAVAGALLGCKLGMKQIPDSWLSGLKHKDWVEEKFQRLISLIKSDMTARGKGNLLKPRESAYGKDKGSTATKDSAVENLSGAKEKDTEGVEDEAADVSETENVKTKEASVESQQDSVQSEDTKVDAGQKTGEEKQ